MKQAIKHRFFLERENALLAVIDVQEKLFAAMDQQEKMVRNIGSLVRTAQRLHLPIVVTEQYPQGLGPTIPPLKELLGEVAPLSKLTFSCCRTEHFWVWLTELGKKTVILTGMEAHICILQTALDLLAAGFSVHLPIDAVCSRRKESWKVALEQLQMAGAAITCTETIAFELLREAGTEDFKVISKLFR
jgi:nicotinamidase-related amidase